MSSCNIAYMKKIVFYDYNEPIFLIAGEGSTFLDGAQISTEGIILDQHSFIPPRNASIEFSFNGTDRILKASYGLKLVDDKLFLKFESISKSDIEFIQNIISKGSTISQAEARF